ncbi:MAG TPA: hypothetical protein VF131_17525 [Blastocatellia bacterium]|nr:hypothetical protein [Blastocatellia bacterium]
MGKKKHNGHADETPDVSFISNPDVRHEVSDVRIKPIIWFGFWLLVSTVAIYLLIFGLFRFFESRATKSDAPAPPLAEERPELPPEPRLQLAPSQAGQPQPNLKEHPLEELKRLKEEEERMLTTYGVDERSGAIRIPIDKAKQLVLERNLLRSAPQSPTQPGAEINRPSNQSSAAAGERRQQ